MAKSKSNTLAGDQPQRRNQEPFYLMREWMRSYMPDDTIAIMPTESMLEAAAEAYRRSIEERGLFEVGGGVHFQSVSACGFFSLGKRTLLVQSTHHQGAGADCDGTTATTSASETPSFSARAAAAAHRNNVSQSFPPVTRSANLHNIQPSAR